MIITPRPDATDEDHHVVVASLALLALDQPEWGDITRSLVVTVYGASALCWYDTVQREYEAAPKDVLHRRRQLVLVEGS